MQEGRQRQREGQENKPMLYEYDCIECKTTFKMLCSYNERDKQKCPKCNGVVERTKAHAVGLIGTRDNFGIKNEFHDNKTGKTIDNWKTWEKAGYRNPVEVTQSHKMKEQVKDNIKKRKGL